MQRTIGVLDWGEWVKKTWKFGKCLEKSRKFGHMSTAKNITLKNS
jgi:hypothetical protein